MSVGVATTVRHVVTQEAVWSCSDYQYITYKVVRRLMSHSLLNQSCCCKTRTSLD